MTESQSLYNDSSSLMATIGLSLVEISVSRHRDSVAVRAVVYRKGGTGIDDCSRAHRLLQARLDEMPDMENYSLETTSPGIDRVIADGREYGIFAGKGVRLFLDTTGEVAGIIESADSANVTITTPDGSISIPLSSIRKGKLDHSQEGR